MTINKMLADFPHTEYVGEDEAASDEETEYEKFMAFNANLMM